MPGTARTTVPAVFVDRVARSADRTALLVKRDGAYRPITWREYGEAVRRVALGLGALGVGRGQTVAILSGNRPEWAFADLGTIAAGAITVPVYATNPPNQVEHILSDAEAVAIVVENRHQLEKVLEVRSRCPKLARIVVIDPTALTDAQRGDPMVLDFARLLALGAEVEAKDPERYARGYADLRPDDVASIIYTSGTTGPPKGAMLTHTNLLASASACRGALHIGEDDVALSFLPLAHIYERINQFGAIVIGFTTAYAENLDTVGENMVEVRPTIMFGVPRFFEKFQARALARVEAGPALRKKIFYWALGVGREVSRHLQAGKPIPAGLRLRHRLAFALALHKVQERVGGRLRFMVSGGAPLARSVAEFFHAAGILILEGYGLTETASGTHVNHVDRYKFGTVGLPLPGVETRIAEDGEILLRGDNIFKGYFKNPEATAAAIKDGWFHTGDIGEIDADGFLRITDRKKDLIVTAGGKKAAPQNIEGLLKGHPLISQVMVYGDRRPFLVALVTLDREELKKFAEMSGIEGSHEEICRHEAVYQAVRRIFDERSATLARFEQIKAFAILPEDFTQMTGELTPTMKIKRKVVAEKYHDVIERLYETAASGRRTE
ncbi:MAG TPA: long-chain fatty acid--CoA ligase [Thermodesulfobacteriota bacterium]